MKRQGRPPLDATASTPSASVHLKLAAIDYEKAEKLAKRQRESLQAMIRRAIKKLIVDERG